MDLIKKKFVRDVIKNYHIHLITRTKEEKMVFKLIVNYV